jgi:hypothetical protein
MARSCNAGRPPSDGGSRAHPCYPPPDVRRPSVVAGMALIALFAAVAVPGPVGSWVPSPLSTPDAQLFTTVELAASAQGPEMTTQPLDPGARSDGSLDLDSTLVEPARRDAPPAARSDAAQPVPATRSVAKNTWRRDPEISWYGPGLIGNGTACGQTLTRTLVGVAHRSLPCGTLVQFRHAGRTVTVPVVDRGPYVGGRIFDLTYAACKKLAHCHTGPIEWRFASGG